MRFSFTGLTQVVALLMNAKLLTPEETHAKVAVIQQIIMAINSLSKVLCLFAVLLVLCLIRLLDFPSVAAIFFIKPSKVASHNSS